MTTTSPAPHHKTMNLLNAYTITSTPGLVADGFFILDAKAWANGEVSTIMPDGAKCPAWATQELAQAALNAWEASTGNNAGSYAGLAVRSLQSAVTRAHGAIDRLHAIYDGSDSGITNDELVALATPQA